MRALALCLLLAAPAAAETPMTAAEFEAFVTGKTLDNIDQNGLYGRETYLPGRKVLWASSGEECATGIWYPVETQICFLYDGDPEPHCWFFWQRQQDLAALPAGELPGTLPDRAVETDQPLACQAPDVGV